MLGLWELLCVHNEYIYKHNNINVYVCVCEYDQWAFEYPTFNVVLCYIKLRCMYRTEKSLSDVKF